MFQALTAPKPDPIFEIAAKFKADRRADKLDLGVGVYQDAEGRTTVFSSVKDAERHLLESQDTKAYLGLAGDEAFSALLSEVCLGQHASDERIVPIQTPGGTGALRLLIELVALANPKARVWVPVPTWPNHDLIVKQAGLQLKTYPYFDDESMLVDFDKMADALKNARKDDVVLIHGCCHNPTGADINREQWRSVLSMAQAQGFVPLIDMAYQGFGDGLEADAFGARLFAKELPEVLIAFSCSKNFGLYRERTGCAIVQAADGKIGATARASMFTLARANYSMPPDHGAAVVRLILDDADLRRSWMDELEGMRQRIVSLRNQLADHLQKAGGTDRFEFIRHHKGMFSLVGATPGQVEALRNDSGIYMIGNSRVNFAGLREAKLEHVARSMIASGM